MLLSGLECSLLPPPSARRNLKPAGTRDGAPLGCPVLTSRSVGSFFFQCSYKSCSAICQGNTEGAWGGFADPRMFRITHPGSQLSLHRLQSPRLAPMGPGAGPRAEPDGGDGGRQAGRHLWVLDAAGLLPTTQQVKPGLAHLPLSYVGRENTPVPGLVGPQNWNKEKELRWDDFKGHGEQSQLMQNTQLRGSAFLLALKLRPPRPCGAARGDRRAQP